MMNNLSLGEHNSNTLWLEPIIPVYLNDKIQLINFAMLPIETKYTNGEMQTALGNIIYSANFAPRKPIKLWGGNFVPAVGPSVVLRTNTYNSKEAYKDNTWNVGASFVATYKKDGFLALVSYSPTWGVGGNRVNSSTLQYLFNYSFRSGTGINTSPLLTYNEELDGWIVPVGLGVSQIFQTKNAIYNVALSGYYNAVRPEVLDDYKWQLQLKLYIILPM
ncbi:hypothetical protein K5X82_00110 [Halosquirtibacter xylanolyticus]|uniref:hypothetical protein n=1 Tax=Halosquirtibacter xylanolyticus TaxID=3374599 RepID=UPI003748C1D7|nr:hypothetical protein K5X82_00110 [Prolixibacteraceae bacterium]